jgi:hypothetical protein
LKVLTLPLMQAVSHELEVADRRKVEAVGPKQAFRSEMTNGKERCRLPAFGRAAVSTAARMDSGGAQNKVVEAVVVIHSEEYLVAAVSSEHLVPFCFPLLPRTHCFFARRFVDLSHRQLYFLYFCPQPLYLYRFPEEREGEQGIHQLDPQFLLH